MVILRLMNAVALIVMPFVLMGTIAFGGQKFFEWQMGRLPT